MPCVELQHEPSVVQSKHSEAVVASAVRSAGCKTDLPSSQIISRRLWIFLYT